MTRARFWTALAGTLALTVPAGALGLFMAFFFAYAFADEVTPARHVTFLVGTLVVAAATGNICRGTVGSSTPEGRDPATVTWATTAVAYLAALGVGTVVSLAYEDQNSVTADQPDAPFVVLVVLCLLGAAAGVALLLRTYRREVVSRG